MHKRLWRRLEVSRSKRSSRERGNDNHWKERVDKRAIWDSIRDLIRRIDLPARLERVAVSEFLSLAESRLETLRN